MKDNPVKVINVMAVLLSIIACAVPVISKIKDIETPGWVWSVLFLTITMCVISVVIDRMVERIRDIEEQLQNSQIEKEAA